MRSKDEIYRKFEDETGEEYYCPIAEVSDSRIVSEWELDHCIEASTVGRYSGHLNVVDRFKA